MESCSILVSSCDKFSTAWHPFFTLLNRYWPNCPYNVFLNTETLSYNEYGVKTINSDELSWTGRLIDSLYKIESDYIIFTLEDFFLMGAVNNIAVEDIVKKMKDDSQIAVVYPKRISGFEERDGEHPEWIRMDFNKSNKYLINCQVAIWNRRVLLDLLKPGLSPWDLERSFKVPEGSPYKFYCLPQGNRFSIEGDIFPYYFAIQNGYGIAKSKWLWNNKKMFARERIPVDFKALGTLSYFQFKINEIKIKFNMMFRKNRK